MSNMRALGGAIVAAAAGSRVAIALRRLSGGSGPSSPTTPASAGPSCAKAHAASAPRNSARVAVAAGRGAVRTLQDFLSRERTSDSSPSPATQDGAEGEDPKVAGQVLWYRPGGKRAKVVEAVNEAVRSAVSAVTANGEKAKSSLERLLQEENALDFMQGLRRFRETAERMLDQGSAAPDDKQPGAEPGSVAAGMPPLLGPLATALQKPTYGIVAHDANAWRSGDDWVVPLEAWIFRRNEDRHVIRLMLCQKLLIEMRHGIKDVDEEEQKRYEERGRLIFRNIAFRGGEERRRLEVRFGGDELGDEWRPLPVETDTHGRVSTEFRLPAAVAAAALARRLAHGGGPPAAVAMEVRSVLPDARGVPETVAEGAASVRLVEESGLSVISDIDDTVKVTEVFLGKDAIVRNTFFEEFRAVQGMAELFQAWAEEGPGTSFHFVSNSPPELLEPLRAFLRGEGFPEAPLHLRPLRGKDRDGFKKRSIEMIIQRFPGRRFVLVGDSGEGDAETYVDLFRRYPGRVAKVLIREVHATRQIEDSVFAGLPRDCWQVFREASEVRSVYQGP